MSSQIKDLTALYAPSGFEGDVREQIINEIKDFASDFAVDNLGNLIAHIKGSGKKVMLTCNMDEIGFMAMSIDDKGYIRFVPVGYFPVSGCLYQKIVFKSGTTGIICPENREQKDISYAKMYIDIGANDKEKALKKVSIGDVACFAAGFEQSGFRLISKSVSSRANCHILIELIKNIRKTENDLYFVFTSQKETDSRGAITAAFAVDADYAIGLGSICADTDIDSKSGISLGMGAVILIRNNSIVSHSYIKDMLIYAAEQHAISYQLEISGESKSDIGTIASSGKGVISGGISIPARHLHTANEMVDICDIENAKKILSEVLTKVF